MVPSIPFYQFILKCLPIYLGLFFACILLDLLPGLGASQIDARLNWDEHGDSRPTASSMPLWADHFTQPSLSSSWGQGYQGRDGSLDLAPPFTIQIPCPYNPSPPTPLTRRSLRERFKAKSHELRGRIHNRMHKVKEGLIGVGRKIKDFFQRHKVAIISLIVNISVAVAVTTALPFLPVLGTLGAVPMAMIGGAVGGVAGNEVAMALRGENDRANGTRSGWQELGHHLKKDLVPAIAGGVGSGVGAFVGGKVASATVFKGTGTVDQVAPMTLRKLISNPSLGGATQVFASSSTSAAASRASADLLTGHSPFLFVHQTVGAMAGAGLAGSAVLATQASMEKHRQMRTYEKAEEREGDARPYGQGMRGQDGLQALTRGQNGMQDTGMQDTGIQVIRGGRAVRISESNRNGKEGEAGDSFGPPDPSDDKGQWPSSLYDAISKVTPSFPHPPVFGAMQPPPSASFGGAQ
ncbi:MAG: hypothetical protein DHS80DRAFT_26360 [Piptocephalis tieghemiana]|nr:MAG: hypothetical protein DHS80DRAFT_26360 [Piptocephalis tieghemiana]